MQPVSHRIGTDRLSSQSQVNLEDPLSDGSQHHGFQTHSTCSQRKQDHASERVTEKYLIPTAWMPSTTANMVLDFLSPPTLISNDPPTPPTSTTNTSSNFPPQTQRSSQAAPTAQPGEAAASQSLPNVSAVPSSPAKTSPEPLQSCHRAQHIPPTLAEYS